METIIKIDGAEYPVRQTMAALVDFREATGKEAYEITGLSDACRMLYYQVRATAEADGRAFDMDFRTFALRVTPEDIQRWGEAVNAENAKGSKKKTTVKNRQLATASIRFDRPRDAARHVQAAKPGGVRALYGGGCEAATRAGFGALE